MRNHADQTPAPAANVRTNSQAMVSQTKQDVSPDFLALIIRDKQDDEEPDDDRRGTPPKGHYDDLDDSWIKSILNEELSQLNFSEIHRLIILKDKGKLQMECLSDIRLSSRNEALFTAIRIIGLNGRRVFFRMRQRRGNEGRSLPNTTGLLAQDHISTIEECFLGLSTSALSASTDLSGFLPVNPALYGGPHPQAFGHPLNLHVSNHAKAFEEQQAAQNQEQKVEDDQSGNGNGGVTASDLAITTGIPAIGGMLFPSLPPLADSIIPAHRRHRQAGRARGGQDFRDDINRRRGESFWN